MSVDDGWFGKTAEHESVSVDEGWLSDQVEFQILVGTLHHWLYECVLCVCVLCVCCVWSACVW